MKELCENNDVSLRQNIKTKKGSLTVSSYRYDRIKKFLTTRDAFSNEPKNSDKYKRLKTTWANEQNSGVMGWKYQFRLKRIGDMYTVERPSRDFINSLPTKDHYAARCFNLAKDSDWVKVVPCESTEFIEIIESIHLSEPDNKIHAKGNALYLAAAKVLTNSVTATMCETFTMTCRICQIVSDKQKPRGKKKFKN